MLNLYDSVIGVETVEPDGNGSPESGEREPGGLEHTTASQVLFLVENPDALDNRTRTLA